MLDRLLGNAQTKADLAAALKGQRLAGSILLVGEPGCGAGFAARCLAADYLYPQGGEGARQVMEGQSPECLEVEGEGASGQIRIERIRAIRREIQGTALSAGGRVVILYQAQRLNPASANALLKTLEEPPPGVLFILTADSQAGLLPTILSRCGVYDLAPISQEECASALVREKGISQGQARELSLLCGGKLGSCLACLESPRKESLALARQLADLVAAREEYAAQVLAAGLEKDKAGQLLLLENLSALALATLYEPSLSPLKAQQCLELTQLAGETRAYLQGNGNTRLALTHFISRLF